jgi:hypothetical protein
MRRTRRYLLAFAVTALDLLAAVAAINLLVDPYRAYRVLASPTLDSAKPTGGNRITKAEMVKHETAETIVLGSSRVEVGIDPIGPALAGRRALNLGLAGATMHEAFHVFQLARRCMPLRTVIFFVDFPAFDASRSPANEDFAKSRFDPSRRAWEYHVGNLIGWDAVECSFRTLGRTMGSQPRQPFPALGHAVPEKLAAMGFRLAVKRQLAASAGARPSAYRLSEPALGQFGELIRTCRRDDIRLYLAFPPIHAMGLEALRAAGKWNDYENWKRAIARLVNEENAAATAHEPLVLWDLCDYGRYNTEAIPPDSAASPHMQYHYDQTHFTPAFGELLLHRILAPSAATGNPELGHLGQRITAANIDAHLARIRADREAYVASHAADLADLLPPK